MKIRTAEFTPYGSVIIVALVGSNFTDSASGLVMLLTVQKYFPQNAIMLVSIQDNGFRAYATFLTSELLALLQLEELVYADLDLAVAPVAPEEEMPF